MWNNLNISGYTIQYEIWVSLSGLIPYYSMSLTIEDPSQLGLKDTEMILGVFTAH